MKMKIVDIDTHLGNVSIVKLQSGDYKIKAHDNEDYVQCGAEHAIRVLSYYLASAVTRLKYGNNT